jgi:hypothetical protein
MPGFMNHKEKELLVDQRSNGMELEHVQLYPNPWKIN